MKWLASRKDCLVRRSCNPRISVKENEVNMKTYFQMIQPMALIATCLACYSGNAASLLKNGDAEDPTMAGWQPNLTGSNGVILSVTLQNQTLATVHPWRGLRFFSFGAKGGLPLGSMGSLSQTGTNGLDGGVLNLRGMIQTEPYGAAWDSGEAMLSLLDGSSNILATASSGPLTTLDTEWKSFQVTLPVVGNAARWRVELRGTLHTGTAINVFYDAIELESVREQLRISVWPVNLWWNSQSNVLYQVQYRTNLVTGDWLPLGLPVQGSGTTNFVSDASTQQDNPRYYRVVK